MALPFQRTNKLDLNCRSSCHCLHDRSSYFFQLSAGQLVYGFFLIVEILLSAREAKQLIDVKNQMSRYERNSYKRRSEIACSVSFFGDVRQFNYNR